MALCVDPCSNCPVLVRLTLLKPIVVGYLLLIATERVMLSPSPRTQARKTTIYNVSSGQSALHNQHARLSDPASRKSFWPVSNYVTADCNTVAGHTMWGQLGQSCRIVLVMQDAVKQ